MIQQRITSNRMKAIIFILSGIFLFSCQPKKAPGKEDKSSNLNNSTINSFDQKMDSLYKLGVFNGYAVAIVDSTGVIYNKGFGYADVSKQKAYTEHTIINIASISKVFIGVALLKAREMNVLNLEDPINKYLPFEVVNPNHPDVPITIRQLATHTSSIVDSDPYMNTCYVNKDNTPIAKNLQEKYGLYYQNPPEKYLPLAEYLNEMLTIEGAFYDRSSFSTIKPGETYEYSNVGAALCALVIESATKLPFETFTKEHIFKPLAMSSTGWFFEEVDSTNYSTLYADEQVLPYYRILSYPDGGLITSSTDLSKFLIDLIKGYSGQAGVLAPESYQEFFKSQLSEEAFGGKENFNVGLFLDKQLAYDDFGHTGGDPGTNTMMFFDSKTKTGRIFITNTDSKKEDSHEVMFGIWNTLDSYLQ